MQESPQALIRAIKDQTQGVPPNMVYVIDLISIRFGGYFTPQIRAHLQTYQNLQMLTLNDCGIRSLQNFPYLPNLIRLDMVFNSIRGEDLEKIKMCRHLQTLMLGANKIQQLKDLQQLRGCRELMQLDLINNPVYRQPGYRQKVFQMFPSLIVLDTLDRSGKDAYNNVTMMETVHRIPEHLFSSNQEESRMLHHVHHEQKSNLRRAISRLGSLDQNVIKVGRRKHLKKVKKNHEDDDEDNDNEKLTRRRSSQFGTLFPAFKIRRMLKQANVNNLKISRSSAVYISAVLQYLTSQFLSEAGQQAKNQGKIRITPLIMKNCLDPSSDLGRLLRYSTFGTLGE